MISILRQRLAKHSLQTLVKTKKKLKENSNRTIYYFGYGANLSIDRFTNRSMNVEEVGNAQLKNHELKFTLSNEYLHKGYAGVHEKENQSVWGVLYKMDYTSLLLLDCLEWAGFGAYERKKVKVHIQKDNSIQECYCYFVKYPKYDLFPSKIYLTNMIKAAKSRSFPQSYIQFLEDCEYKENFEINHNFSLLFYGKERMLYKQLRSAYVLHDKLREKLCDLI